MVAKYRLNGQHYLTPHGENRDRILEDGQEIEFDGVPSAFMIPLNEDAEKAVRKRNASSDYHEPVASIPLRDKQPEPAGKA